MLYATSEMKYKDRMIPEGTIWANSRIWNQTFFVKA